MILISPEPGSSLPELLEVAELPLQTFIGTLGESSAADGAAGPHLNRSA